MIDGEAAMPAEGTAAPGAGPTSGDVADPAELARQIRAVAEKSQRLVADFLKRQSPEEGLGMASPLAIGAAFFEMTARMMADPSRLVQAQLSLVERLHDPVAAHRAALSRRQHRADDRAAGRRPPFPRRRLARQHAV